MMENHLIIYEDKDGKTKVSVKFIGEDIWLTQNQIAIYIKQRSKILVYI